MQPTLCWTLLQLRNRSFLRGRGQNVYNHHHNHHHYCHKNHIIVNVIIKNHDEDQEWSLEWDRADIIITYIPKKTFADSAFLLLKAWRSSRPMRSLRFVSVMRTEVEKEEELCILVDLCVCFECSTLLKQIFVKTEVGTSEQSALLGKG